MKKEANTPIQFIGIGAKRAATTWIARRLDEHPQIAVPAEKSLNFFGNDEKYHLGREWYLAQFPSDAHIRARGEFCASYLTHRDVPGRIRSTLPDARLIVSLRNPVERAVSHLRYWQSKGSLPRDISIEAAAKRFPGIIEGGHYSEFLERFFDCFPREQVHIVLFDDIQQTPQAVMKDMYRFLGVADDFVSPHLSESTNASMTRFSPFHKMINKIHLTLRKLPGGRRIISFMRPLRRTRRWYEGSAQRVPAVSPADVSYLRECYREDIERTEALIGRDLSAWKRPVQSYKRKDHE